MFHVERSKSCEVADGRTEGSTGGNPSKLQPSYLPDPGMNCQITETVAEMICSPGSIGV